MIKRILLILFFLSMFSGCVSSKGDISNSIEKWNAVTLKNNEAFEALQRFTKKGESDNLIIDAEMKRSNPNYQLVLSIFNDWDNDFDDIYDILGESSTLISDFSGSTVSLSGEARTYSDEMLVNIRESNKYMKSGIQNYQEGISTTKTAYEYLESGNYERDTIMAMLNKAQLSFSGADDDFEKAGEYSDKANDAMRKLEALQY